MVSVEALERFMREHVPAAPAPTPSLVTAPAGGRGIAESADTLRQYLESHGQGVSSTKPLSGGAVLLILDGCPFCSEHGNGTDTAVIWRTDGVGFECKHNTCAQYGWRDVRSKIDPAWLSTPVSMTASNRGVDSLPKAIPWQTIREIGNASDYAAGLPAISTGFVVLDRMLKGGFRPESVYIVAGRTSSAKSTLVANIARRVALNGDSVLFIKLEESPRELIWRMHAAAAQVRLDVLLNGRETATTDEAARLDDAWRVLADLPLRVVGCRDANALESAIRMHVANGGRLVIIDQASMVSIPELAPGYERMTEVSARLRLLSIECHIPIVLVAQVNRAASKDEKRLTCNDLRDSGTLENDAGAVILLDRSRLDSGANVHHGPWVLEVLIDKNRYGAVTRDDDPPLELTWDKPTGRIDDRPETVEGWQ